MGMVEMVTRKFAWSKINGFVSLGQQNNLRCKIHSKVVGCFNTPLEGGNKKTENGEFFGGRVSSSMEISLLDQMSEAPRRHGFGTLKKTKMDLSIDPNTFFFGGFYRLTS